MREESPSDALAERESDVDHTTHIFPRTVNGPPACISVRQCVLQIVAVASFLLAGKVEETPNKLQQVLHAAVEARYRDQPQLIQQVMVRPACCSASL